MSARLNQAIPAVISNNLMVLSDAGDCVIFGVFITVFSSVK